MNWKFKFILSTSFLMVLALGYPCFGEEAMHGAPCPSGIEDFYSRIIAWEIKPGMVWEKVKLNTGATGRENTLGDLYEEIKLDGKAPLEKAPLVNNIFGLRVLKYYVIGEKGDKRWSVVDSFGKKCFEFEIYYSSNRTYSRQMAMEKFMEEIRRMPHEHGGKFMYQADKNGTKMLIRKEKRLIRPYMVEKKGFSLRLSLWYDMKDAEVLPVSKIILDALAGGRKLGYFPERAKRFEKWSKLSLPEREQLMHQLENTRGSMSATARDGLYEYGEKMIEALNMEAVFDKADRLGEKIVPNINRGVGTVKWIKKHMDIPFTPEQGNDEKHVDGITGTFFVKKEEREYPVEYMIAHLPSRELAMSALFSMQARKEVDAQTKEEDIKRVAEMTHLHPGLVGDYDLCLKPVLNGLGVPIPNSEQAWICFVRGNTAVMLKSLDMKVSVLSLARAIDEALKNAIKLYETPEEIR